METRTCPDCGNPVSGELLDGICPACLAGLLGSDPTDPTRSSNDPTGPAGSGSPDRHRGPGDETGPRSNSRGRKDTASEPTGGSGRARSSREARPKNVLLDVPGHEVTAEIARGGMGIVYRATELDPRREVALKMLLASQVGMEHLHDHFLLEARAIARLDHPNILPIYHLGEHEGIPFFTMKLATNGSLHHRRMRYREQWTQIAELMATLADAVSYAHQRGVLHRDLKPGNVLFDDANRPYVSDFGLARVLEKDGILTPEGSHLVGTPRYMSPEVIEGGADATTTASDVYALGLMFYELIAQRGPFDAANEHEHMRRVVSEPIPRPSTFMPGIPPELEQLCLHCLEHERSQRLSSASLLRDELRRWLAGEPLQLQITSPWQRGRRWMRRHKLTAVSGLLTMGLTLLALIAAGVAVNRMIRFDRVRLLTQDRVESDLINARLGAAQALRHLGYLGQRQVALNMLHEAAQVRITAPLRSEAIAQLTAPDTGEEVVRFALGSDLDRVEASADLDLLAVSSANGEINVWRRSTAKLLWHLRLSLAQPPTVLEFSPAGDWLAVGAATSAVGIYEVATGLKIHAVTGIWSGFSADNHQFISWQRNELRQQALASGDFVGHTTLVTAPPAPPLFASGKGAGAAWAIIPRTNSLDLIGNEGQLLYRLPWIGPPPTSFCWSSNLVAVGESTGLLRTWSLPDLLTRTTPAHQTALRRLWLETETGRLWSTSVGGESRWWDARTLTLLGESPGWRLVRPATDGRRLLVVDDRAVSVRPLWSGTGRTNVILPSTQSVLHLEFAAGTTRFVAVQRDAMSLGEGTTGQRVALALCRAARSAHFSPRGGRLLLIEADQLRWFQVNPSSEGAELKEFRPPTPFPEGTLTAGVATPHHQMVLLQSPRGEVLTVDVEKAEFTTAVSSIERNLLIAGDEAAQTLAYSSRGKGTWASMRYGGRQYFAQNNRWGPLFFSPDGQRILQPGPEGHRMLDLIGGAPRWTTPAEAGAAGAGLGAWPTESRVVVAAARRGPIHLLATESGEGSVDLNPPGPLSALGVSDDGQLVAAGTETGTLSIWNLPSLESSLLDFGLDLPFNGRARSGTGERAP